MSQNLRAWTIACLGILAIGGAVISDASAQSLERFYKVKGLRIVVGSGAGGGYDTYTRAFGRHYTNHLPGNPRIV
ncbi:MAG: Bug family tripartite tricarboxylate transporter substrate binding protein, partial [Alphaproteobacteria bacterium]